MKVISNFVAALSLKGEFAERRDKLYRIAYSWCHDPDLADDLAQDSMVKAMKNAAQLRDPGTIDTWLYRILYHNWQDHLRISGRNVEYVEMKDESHIDQPTQYQQSQIVDRVRGAVEKLPLELREAVTLADFAGFSYSQIAEIVEIPIGTVMSRLHRARQTLKQQLLDFGSDDHVKISLRRVK